MYNCVLVTGGTGMVGRALAKCVGNNPNIVFVGSKDTDLSQQDQTEALFERVKPDAVIHLAAVVGGLFYNIGHNAEMLDINTRISLNIAATAVKTGVKRVILVNSTCAFPINPEKYPMTEDDLHAGPVHPTNEGYGASKRVMEIIGRLYNQGSTTRFVTVYPCNIYGIGDNFDPKSCHVLSGLMRRCHEAKESGTEMVVWGSGKPLRQFIYADDIARLLLLVLDRQEEDSMILCGDDDELTINELASEIASIVGLLTPITNDTTKSDGMFRKTVSNAKLRKAFPGFKFTPLDQGLTATYEWWLNSRPSRITGNLPGCKGLAGGIGNQFFLIAAVYARMWRLGGEAFLRFDAGLKYRYTNDYTNNLLSNFEFDNNADLSGFRTLTADTYLETVPGNVLLEGYFQSPKYFDDHKDRIISLLTKTDADADMYIASLRSRHKSEIIGVQVRRGDYLQLGWDLSADYYRRSMDRYPGVTFMISTDDKAWCAANFPGIEVINLPTDVSEFYALSQLDGCIMSQSTFGWWAAYLGRMTKVVIPDPWSRSSKYSQDLYLDGWTRMSR